MKLGVTEVFNKEHWHIYIILKLGWQAYVRNVIDFFQVLPWFLLDIKFLNWFLKIWVPKFSNEINSVHVVRALCKYVGCRISVKKTTEIFPGTFEKWKQKGESKSMLKVWIKVPLAVTQHSRNCTMGIESVKYVATYIKLITSLVGWWQFWT